MHSSEDLLYTALNFTTQHNTTQHYITLHYTTLHNIKQHYNPLNVQNYLEAALSLTLGSRERCHLVYYNLTIPGSQLDTNEQRDWD